MYSPRMDGTPTSIAALPNAASQAQALPAALSVVPPPEPVAPVQTLSDSRWFINRELSWIAFNERVLEEACDPTVPALERLKFLAITSSNLDEFFMIRVAGLKSQLSGHVDESGPDALSPGDPTQRVVVQKGAQVGLTECGNNWLGYVIHHAPGPIAADRLHHSRHALDDLPGGEVHQPRVIASRE